MNEELEHHSRETMRGMMIEYEIIYDNAHGDYTNYDTVFFLMGNVYYYYL